MRFVTTCAAALALVVIAPAQSWDKTIAPGLKPADALDLTQPACQPVDHFVVHSPAVAGMRMADQRRADRQFLRFFEQGFETSGRAVQEQAFDFTRHRDLGFVWFYS